MGLIHLPWQFLIFIISFTLIYGRHDVDHKCREDQKSKLLQLKHDLRVFGSISGRLAVWKTSMDCCSWEGVTCNNGRVIGLDLSGERIYDGFNSSSSLFDLRFLQRLNLAYNNFNSVEIPHGFDKFANMTYLNLSNSWFSGQIPTGISSLKQLVTLDISNNYTTDYAISFAPSTQLKLESPNLRMLIQNLSKLEELYLDGVFIEADGYEWCKALSSSVPNLRVLSLSNCHLSGPIDSSLARLVSLTVVHLDNNSLSTTVPKFFSNFSNLTVLSFYASELNGLFPTEIFLLPNLQIIDLRFNAFLEVSFPEPFPWDSSLQSMALGTTCIPGKIPNSLHNLKMLSSLELGGCNIIGAIPSSIEKLTQLRYLDLSGNKFTGNVPSFNLAKNLSVINLSKNKLTGQIDSLQWENNQKLVTLDLRYNSLTGTIPLSLFALPLLQEIGLSHNQFTGMINEFPTASSSPLRTLDLRRNNLEGSIPVSIFQLTALETLDLSYNNFNATVDPNMIKELKNLFYISLSFNKLSISASRGNLSFSSGLPQFTTLSLASCKLEEFPNLQNQSSLIALDISSNQIRGEIPRWLWEIGNGSLQELNLSSNKLVSFEKPLPKTFLNLTILDLHGNLLQGQIPVFTSTPTFLDYSSNNFSSFIPNEIGDIMIQTVFFSVAHNSLTGTIPESICNASIVQILDLSFNKLNGTIPPCLFELDSIGVLNLRWNRLSGAIPETSTSECGLRTFDINKNQIDGPVPRALANCSRLEVLNLGNNQISDTFPFWIEKLSTLRVLVLRSNKFYGPVKCFGSIGNLTMLQIIDLASNNFSGNLSSQCFLSWTAMISDVNASPPEAKQLLVKFGNGYYSDTVTLTFKGQQQELEKILTLFTTIDFSKNNFEGDIPEVIGELKALYLLNLSRNAFTGRIPTTLANITYLESLDLSHNKLTGNIPTELADLTFLSHLNVSFNKLVGTIPSGQQFNTYANTSYLGNKGLCGYPLSKHCSNNPRTPPPRATQEDGHSNSGNNIILDYISAEIGFAFGLGIVIWPLVF